MSKKEMLIHILGFGLSFLFVSFLNIVPNVNGLTQEISWRVGVSIGWMFGVFSATLIHERRKK